MASNITDLVDAIHSGKSGKITAVSLSRVGEHTKDLDQNHFAMLTAWRYALPTATNKSNMISLKSEVRKLGLGFVPLVGHWAECQDEEIPYPECPDDQKVDSTEPSLLVPGLTLKQAHRLGKKYKQDAVVYGGPDAGGKVVLVYSNGRVEPIGSRMSPRIVDQAFFELSKRKGQKFNFLSYAAASPIEAQAASVYERSRYGICRYKPLSGSTSL